MTRFVIAPDAALRLAQEQATPAPGHELLAPTLFRSQVLARVFADVRNGVLPRADAGRRLTHVRRLHARFLGDRVLQDVAWRLADELGLPDTLDAEYIALTRLQADAFVTLDEGLARVASTVVRVAPYEDLLR